MPSTPKKPKIVRAVGFDFDDTLIQSEKEKAEIYVSIFEAHFGRTRGVKTCYRSLRGKLNREAKLKEMIHILFNRTATKKEVTHLSKHFSQEYMNRLKSCPLVSCRNIFKELRPQVDLLFLLSLENRKDVMAVAKHCGIDGYFHKILGGPEPKLKQMKALLKEKNIKPSQTVYIGDSRGDMLTAKSLNVHPIGISKTNGYNKILKGLGAHFTFSSVCDVPYGKILNGKH